MSLLSRATAMVAIVLLLPGVVLLTRVFWTADINGLDTSPSVFYIAWFVYGITSLLLTMSVVQLAKAMWRQK